MQKNYKKRNPNKQSPAERTFWWGGIEFLPVMLTSRVKSYFFLQLYIILMIIGAHLITSKVKRPLKKRCRSQLNGGASNIMSNKSSAATETIKLNPEASATRCYFHSLNLTFKRPTGQCQLFKDTLGTVCKLCRLVKHSVKWQKLLGEYQTTIHWWAKLNKLGMHYYCYEITAKILCWWY